MSLKDKAVTSLRTPKGAVKGRAGGRPEHLLRRLSTVQPRRVRLGIEQSRMFVLRDWALLHLLSSQCVQRSAYYMWLDSALVAKPCTHMPASRQDAVLPDR